jgi:hypothetical protein
MSNSLSLYQVVTLKHSQICYHHCVTICDQHHPAQRPEASVQANNTTLGSLDKKRKNPTHWSGFFVVRLVGYRWNHIYPSLRLMYEKLVRFGFTYDGDTVIFDPGSSAYP